VVSFLSCSCCSTLRLKSGVLVVVLVIDSCTYGFTFLGSSTSMFAKLRSNRKVVQKIIIKLKYRSKLHQVILDAIKMSL
jgi:hypothetical protein